MPDGESHRGNSLSLSLPENNSIEKTSTCDDASLNDVSLLIDSGPNSSSYNAHNLEDFPDRCLEPSSQSTEVLLRDTADVIYEGGLEDKDDIEYKVIFEDTDSNELLDNEGNNVEINVRGVKYNIPFAIECHLCNEMMNLCLRRTRYRGQSREYPAYRCNRKGCQTFRSIRKVFSNCMPGTSDIGNMVYQPPIESPKKQPSLREEFSEDESDEFVVQRVYIPKLERNNDMSLKSLSHTDRMRKANQERATVFSEFAEQLRRDIAANKRVRVRKNINEEDEQQGTLFYISKELSPQEIIELQDAIIKTLISLRKIPPPMTMHDLPLFANCPYSKKSLEAGLAKSQNDFWTAFTNSPQPPLPAGFTRRKDDTLIYKDPNPYEVPEILQENSPRKQADSIVNYHRRKEEQDARKMERRHVEKKYRSWASLKREFDMAETEEHLTPKRPKGVYESSAMRSSNSERQSRQVTLEELMTKMGDNSKGQLTCRIRASSSERSSESMQWIDLKNPDAESTEDSAKRTNCGEYKQQGHDSPLDEDDFGGETKFKPTPLMQDVMRSLSTPNSLRPPISPLMKSFSSIENGNLKNAVHPHASMFFSDPHFLNNHNHINSSPFYALNSFLPQYQVTSTIDPSLLYQNRSSADEHFHCVGASEIVRTEPIVASPFTYIHPDSGVRLTDPSAFLTSFIPSPITKLAPMNFPEETTRLRRSSEPTTSCAHNTDGSNGLEDRGACGEDNKKRTDDSLKFETPIEG